MLGLSGHVIYRLWWAGQKYEFAVKWNINIVSPKWLDDSVKAGYSLAESSYRVASSTTSKSGLTTSTPTADNGSLCYSLSSDFNVYLHFCVFITSAEGQRLCFYLCLSLSVGLLNHSNSYEQILIFFGGMRHCPTSNCIDFGGHLVHDMHREIFSAFTGRNFWWVSK